MIDDDAEDGAERKELEDVARLLKDAAREGRSSRRRPLRSRLRTLLKPSTSLRHFATRPRLRSSSMGRRMRFRGANTSPTPRL